MHTYTEYEDIYDSEFNKEWKSYGAKEVPNVKVTLYDNELKPIGSFINNALVNFYEEINSDEKDSKMILVSALLSPQIIDLLRTYAYAYHVETEEIWRNVKTGKDTFFRGPKRIYKHMKMRYQLAGENGNSARWYIIFYNKPHQIKEKNPENLMNMRID